MATVNAVSSGRVTSHHVAERAGVTQSTVSLVLSGKGAGRASAELQERVRQAAAELGYRPSESARALRSGQTRALGLLVPDVTNPFLGLVMHGAQQASWSTGFAAILMESGRGVAHQRRAVDALQGGLVDGVLLFGIAPASGGVPLRSAVLIEVQRRGLPSVVLDSAAGLRMVAEHLHIHGHRRVAYLGLSGHRWTFDRRRRDWFDAWHRVEGEARPRSSDAADLTIEAAAAASLTLLRSRPRPTAVVCADDILAAGVYAAAAQLHLEIPRELSVVGYTGTIVGAALQPALTTVLTPAEDLGGRAVELLLDHMRGRRVPARTVLPVELAQRASVSAPRRR